MIDMGMRPIVYDLPNPAKSIVQDASLEFGITIPHYNGAEAFLRAGHFGGGVVGLALAAPTLTIDEPGDLPNGYTHRGRITAVAVHNIEWEIHLVPDPGPRGFWEWVARDGTRLWSFVDSLARRFPEAVAHPLRPWLDDPNYRRRFGLPGPWTLRVHAMPSGPAFMSHLLAHECKHMEDHAWLAQEILGPLDEWHDHHHQAGTEFMAGASRYNLYGVLLAGTSETSDRLIQYWQNAIWQSGEVFHETVAGAHPIVTVRNIQRSDVVGDAGLLELDVRPVHQLHHWGFDLDDPRPHCHPQVFNVETGRLGGNEAFMAHRNAAGYQTRVIDYGEALHGRIAVDDGEEVDGGIPDWFLT